MFITRLRITQIWVGFVRWPSCCNLLLEQRLPNTRDQIWLFIPPQEPHVLSEDCDFEVHPYSGKTGHEARHFRVIFNSTVEEMNQM